MKVKLIEQPTIEQRDDNVIILFPSRPYWFSATKEIEVILNIFQNEIEAEFAVRCIADYLSITLAEAKETINEVCSLLYENGVLFINRKLSQDIDDIEPHFQLNAVENIIVIAATSKCNLSCKHCYANAKKSLPDEMTTEEVKKFLDDLEAMPWKNDISRVGLTGGEFFTRPDAIEIIDYAHGKKFKILISSNGLLLNDEIISKLANYENIKISVSLDGPDANSHEFVRGIETFNQTVKVIKKLAGRGIFVGVNMFIHQKNIEYIEDTLCLARKLGVKSFNCLNLMRVGRANSRQSQNKFIHVSDCVLYKKIFEILRQNQQYQKLMKNSTFANQIMGIAGGVKSYYCGIGTNRALYIRANGNVYPCPDTALKNFYLGNIRNEKLFDIWNNSTILHELRQLNVDTMNPICAKCDVRYFCGGGCRGENYQVTKDIKSPHFNCQDIRKTIFEMMWMLTDEPTFFQDKVEDLYQKVFI